MGVEERGEKVVDGEGGVEALGLGEELDGASAVAGVERALADAQALGRVVLVALHGAAADLDRADKLSRRARRRFAAVLNRSSRASKPAPARGSPIGSDPQPQTRSTNLREVRSSQVRNSKLRK